jgi:hypothetical protein
VIRVLIVEDQTLVCEGRGNALGVSCGIGRYLDRASLGAQAEMVGRFLVREAHRHVTVAIDGGMVVVFAAVLLMHHWAVHLA